MSKTPPEIQQLLDKFGVTIGEWDGMEEHSTRPPVMDRQAQTLVKLKKFLDQMVAQDQQALATLREQLSRLEHGGGS